MIPFDELVATLERYKQRKLAIPTASVPPSTSRPSGKAVQEAPRPPRPAFVSGNED